MALKPEYQKFVNAFLISFNATQSAIDAGFSEKTARQQGSRLLTNVDIAMAIKEELDAHAMQASEVLYHLTQIARGDMGVMLNEWGEIDVRQAKVAHKTNLIKKFKTKVTRSSTIALDRDGEGREAVQPVESHTDEIEIEMYDRLKALELLAKYHNLVNRVIVEDWHTEAIALIQRGQLAYAPLALEIGDTLATELFKSAGVPVAYAGETPESD